jgi:phosphodiesterase/alkaline phosphatase D-like protein
MKRTACFVVAAVSALACLAAAHAPSQQNMQITKGPVLEMVSDTSAVIAWSTNVPGSTVVRYSTDPNNLMQTAEAPWGQTTHRVTLSGLQPSTTYYYQLQSGQAQGTVTGALSSIQTFQTVAQGSQPKHYSSQ